MKTLLLNLPINLDDKFDYEQIIQPYGLASISAYLKKYGCEVTLFDAQAYRLVRKETLDYVKKINPDIIGIGCMTFHIFTVVSFIKDLKKHFPRITVVLGGSHVSAEPESTLRNHKEIDIVVIGEGERVMLELIRKMSNGKRLDDIDGLGFRRDGEIVINNKRQIVEDLDSLPFADWESLPMDRYWDSITRRKNHARVYGSRGCPYSCTFCAVSITLGKKVRRRSPEHLVNEIALLYDRYKVRDLVIGDSTFNMDNEWVSDICERIIKLRRPVVWTCGVRADRLDKDTLKLMKRSGCIKVVMAIESGDENVLRMMKKGQTLEQIREGLKILDEVGISANHPFILGMPGETQESMDKTIRLAKSINHVSSFNIATPLPGSEFYEYAKKKGLTVDDWSKFDCYSISYVPEGLTREKLEEGYRRAIRAVYCTPRHLIRRILELKSWYQLLIYLRYFYRILMRRVKIRRKSR